MACSVQVRRKGRRQTAKGGGAWYRFALLLLMVMAGLAWPFASVAQLNQGTPAILEQIGVDEKLSEMLPLDVPFRTSDGEEVMLGDLFVEGKPVLLNPLYYECPMLCNLVVEAVYSGVRDLAWTPGQDYVIISFSIDPEETPEMAARSKERYLGALNRPGSENGWHFLTGSEESIRRVTEAIGFRYIKEERTGEYLHPSSIQFISPEGVITRYLHGIQFTEFNLRNALYEAADGQIGSRMEQAILFCFQYDPASESYIPFARNIMKLGGLVTLVVLGIFLGLFWFGKNGRPWRITAKNRE